MKKIEKVSRGYNIYDNITEILDSISSVVHWYKITKEHNTLMGDDKVFRMEEFPIEKVDEGVKLAKELLKIKINKNYNKLDREGILTSISRSSIFSDPNCKITNVAGGINIGYKDIYVSLRFIIKDDKVIGVE